MNHINNLRMALRDLTITGPYEAALVYLMLILASGHSLIKFGAYVIG